MSYFTSPWVGSGLFEAIWAVGVFRGMAVIGFEGDLDVHNSNWYMKHVRYGVCNDVVGNTF